MNKLKELRQEQGQTQDQVASAVGVSKRTYIYWEKGERQIKPEKAQQLADYFGVSVGYMLGYSLARDRMLKRLPLEVVEFFDDDNDGSADVYAILTDILGAENLNKLKKNIMTELKNSYGHYFELPDLWVVGLDDAGLSEMWELHTQKFIEFINSGDTPYSYKKLIFYFSLLSQKERESIINILEGLTGLDVDFY